MKEANAHISCWLIITYPSVSVVVFIVRMVVQEEEGVVLAYTVTTPPRLSYVERESVLKHTSTSIIFFKPLFPPVNGSDTASQLSVYLENEELSHINITQLLYGFASPAL